MPYFQQTSYKSFWSLTSLAGGSDKSCVKKQQINLLLQRIDCFYSKEWSYTLGLGIVVKANAADVYATHGLELILNICKIGFSMTELSLQWLFFILCLHSGIKTEQQHWHCLSTTIYILLPERTQI